MKTLAGSALLLVLLIALSCTPKAPKGMDLARHNWVMDEIDLLSTGQEDSIASLSKELEADVGSQVAVLIIDSPGEQSIEEFSLKKANEFALGRASHNDGVLITVARSDRKVRIEVGTGLEQIITDDIAARLINEDLVPRFRRQKYTEGIYVVVSKIADLIKENENRIGQNTDR